MDGFDVMNLYAARDKRGSLYMFRDEPVKNEELGIWQTCDGSDDYFHVPDNLFPGVFWKDSRATPMVLGYD